METDIFVRRINVFGITWGTILNLVLALCGTAQHHFGYSYPFPKYAPDEVVLNLFLSELAFVCFGIILAVPYALAFKRVSSKRQISLKDIRVVSVIVGALCCLPILIWFVFWPGSAYGPEGIFNGGLRVGLVGYVAALVAAYASAITADAVEPQSERPRLAFVLAAEMVLVLLIIAAVLFPTFQKVRGEVAVTQNFFAKTNLQPLTLSDPSCVPWTLAFTSLGFQSVASIAKGRDL